MLSGVPSSARRSTALSRTSCRQSRAFCGFRHHRASRTRCSHRCSARSRHRTRTFGSRFWSPIGLSTLSPRGSIWRFASAHFEIHRSSLGRSLPTGISWLRAPLTSKGSKLQDRQEICSITSCWRSHIGDPITAGPFGINTKKIRKRCRLSRICSMNDYNGLAAALVAGVSIGDLPPVVQPQLISDGRLVEVMPEWHFRAFDLSVVHLSNRHISRPVRFFKEFAVQMSPALLPALPV